MSSTAWTARSSWPAISTRSGHHRGRHAREKGAAAGAQIPYPQAGAKQEWQRRGVIWRVFAALCSRPRVSLSRSPRLPAGRSRPIRRVASGPVSLRRCSNEATSVSRMTGCTAGSGEVAVTLGVGEGQELLKLLVGLEDVSREVVERLDRPGVLSRQQLSGRQARPGWRTCRTVRETCGSMASRQEAACALALAAAGKVASGSQGTVPSARLAAVAATLISTPPGLGRRRRASGPSQPSPPHQGQTHCDRRKTAGGRTPPPTATSSDASSPASTTAWPPDSIPTEEPPTPHRTR